MHDRMKTLKRWWEKGSFLIEQFNKAKVGTHASSIAYFVFLSIIPLLALFVSIVLLVGVSQQDVTAFFVALLPNALDGLAKDLISDAFARSGIALSLSTLTLLWSASRGMDALRVGLNAVFDEEETRSFPALVILSVVAAVILCVMLAVMMYLIFSDGVMSLLSGIVPNVRQRDAITDVMEPLVMIAIVVPVLALCYTRLPAGKRRFAAQLPGAVLATFGCGALVFGFRLYVDNFGNFTVLYGSIATVALLLMWIYFMATILIIGAFVNRALARRKPKARKDG